MYESYTFQVSFRNWNAEDEFPLNVRRSPALACSLPYRATQTCAAASRSAPSIHRSGCWSIQSSSYESSDTPSVTANTDPSTLATNLRMSASTAQVKGMRLNFAAISSIKRSVQIETNAVC
jgi:hypothetical protein